MRDPHANEPFVATGPALDSERTVVIAVHGRGASPDDILSLATRLGRPEVSFLAPAAAHRTWYPYSFLADIPRNEPYLTSALSTLGRMVAEVERAGVPRRRIIFMGFSQGACLSSEFVVRNPGRWGGLIAFSGGLIGPPGTTWDESGSLDGTPAFLGCSDVDAHIPRARVEESASVFTRMAAAVTLCLYPGMGHVVNDDEISRAGALIDSATGA